MGGFYVGHGRHWDFFRLAGYSDNDLMSVFGRVSLACQGNILCNVGELNVICEPDQEFGVGLLMNGSKIASAFPHVNGGHIWPIAIRQQNGWPTVMEGQLVGSCLGAKVGWFDGQYGARSSLYKETNQPLNFQINGLAYAVWRTQFETPEHEQLMGGTKAYMPLVDDGGYIASEDEIQFMSHVDEVRSLAFFDVPIDVYTITIALLDDFPMKLNLYAPRVVSKEKFSPGDAINGVCWLFGSYSAGKTDS